MDVSDIFYFFLLGEWKGESEVPGGVVFFPCRGGRVSRRGRGRGSARVSASNWGIFGGGGPKFFFGGSTKSTLGYDSSRPVIGLRSGHRPEKSHLLRPPKP